MPFSAILIAPAMCSLAIHPETIVYAALPVGPVALGAILASERALRGKRSVLMGSPAGSRADQPAHPNSASRGQTAA